MLEASGSDYPLLNVMWTMFVFFMAVLWIWLVIAILSDIFRRRDISGWTKAGWTGLVIVLPFLGVLIYVIGQGASMAERRELRVETSVNGYVPQARSSSPNNGASEITQAKELLDSGAITTDEYQTLKTKALAS